MDDIEGEVIAVAQRVLKSRHTSGPYERTAIEDAVQAAAQLLGAASAIDHGRVVVELEARTAISIGRATKLVDSAGHVPWYIGERRRSGPFYRRYRDYLIDVAGWSAEIVDNGLGDATDQIMELIEDPSREGPWDRRGLVVGHVQSGKTANYAGLMCKTADAGYRLIVVLAGMHNVLRKQTQQRLDRDFLGYSTLPGHDGAPRESIGVGQINPHCHADFLTNQAINGDFNRNRADAQGTGTGEVPIMLVVKKNASVLANLNTWVDDRLARRGDTRTAAVLVIDDEADQASVDTGAQDFDDEGVPDPDYEPKRINGQVRKLLQAFEKSAYVAYTATPFANVLIHDERSAEEFGADLFPRSFIINLAAPSNYIGPAALFGLDTTLGDGPSEPLPLIRTVEQEAEGWLDEKHKNGAIPLYRGERRIPPSLEQAIFSFLLTVAARRARGRRAAHNSMLIHVSRFNSVQREAHDQVDAWLKDVKRRLRYRTGADDLLATMRRLWEDDYVPTTAEVEGTPFGDNVTSLAWEDIDAELSGAAESIEPRLVNSQIKEPLDYEGARETGLNIIAIGGDKLSRGLTLEDLSVSYFLRQSGAYDTLMQTGRWFGYRPGYVDLCRLFTTADMRLWFRHIATAFEELRDQFDHMAALGATPKQYGLKIQSHEHLLVTALTKMRYAMEVQVTFAGEGKVQTVFQADAESIAHNAASMASFLFELGPPAEAVAAGGATWTGVDGALVATCLSSLDFPRESYDVNGVRLADYIRAQLEIGELTDWTVAVRSGVGEVLNLGPLKIATVQRKPLRDDKPGRYIVKTVLSPRDEALDLSDSQFQEALAQTNRVRAGRGLPATDTPGGHQIRHVRGLGSQDGNVQGSPARGLLLVYPLSPVEAGLTNIEVPIIGLVVSFPASLNSRPIRYRYNSVMTKLELQGR